jgi:hypothetical protein
MIGGGNSELLSCADDGPRATSRQNDQIPPAIAIVLWPTSILGLVDPVAFTDQIITGLFTFGGKFLLYGLVGAAVRYMGRKLHLG